MDDRIALMPVVEVEAATLLELPPPDDFSRPRRQTAFVRAVADARTPVLSFLGTILAALVVSAPILLIAGAEPLGAYKAILDGSLGDSRAVGETLVAATPLILAGLAVTVAFRAGVLNLGVEGQLVLGGVVAAAVGVNVHAPTWIHLPLAIGAACAAGAAWAGIAGVLKAFRGVHEVITTIMLNYVAFSASTYLVGADGVLASNTQPSASERVAASAQLGNIWRGTRLHAGLVAALVAAAACTWFLFRSPLGYRFRVVGANETAARFNGIDPRRVTVQAMALSGALAGATGAVEVLGLHGRYFDAFSPGYGFDSIAVALLGFLHPLGVVMAAGFFGLLRAGSVKLQATAGVSRDVITVISGVVIAFVAGRPFLERTLARWHRARRATR